tara:strand:+ start:2615 stop:2791 length:177 start_codon:yes stop_codon:yes gene_type:complete
MLIYFKHNKLYQKLKFFKSFSGTENIKLKTEKIPENSGYNFLLLFLLQISENDISDPK